MFGSVLACAKSAHVSQNLLLALRNLSICFVTNNSSSDSKAYLRFIAFSGSPMAVQRAFLFFDAKARPQSQTYLLPTVLHCVHTFLRRIDILNSIITAQGGGGGGVIPIWPVITTATEIKILTVNFSQFLDLDC